MKILLVGASGTISKAVEQALSRDHTLVRANHSGGDVQVDLGSPESIQAMFATVGPVDAVISAAGVASVGAFKDLTDADYELALQNKLMGQINLTRFGRTSINEGGSITLTSGVKKRCFARRPIERTRKINGNRRN